MVIVKIYGGLGNQMFQYAFARALSLKYNRELVVDKSYFNKENYPFHLHADYYPYKLDLYNLESEFTPNNISKFIKSIKRKRLYRLINPLMVLPGLRKRFPQYYSKWNFSFSQFEKSKVAYLEGFWQKYTLIGEFKPEIRKDLSLQIKSVKNTTLLKQIQTSNSVAVHFRLGDYVSNPKFKAVYAQCNLEYYTKAMEYIAERSNNPTFFIFSDTIEWVKENLKSEQNIVFVDTEDVDHEHLYFMSQSKHNVIANSSFSWWGAWLNDNPEKIVIAPQSWFRDTDRVGDIHYPDDWMRMENI